MDIRARNVLLYVDDAVRYDAVADRLAGMGATYRTVAASSHTPTSFGSILTGLYPDASGVKSFRHSPAPGVRSLFDLESHRVTMPTAGGMNHSIAAMFGEPPRTDVEDLDADEPWIHVLRRPGGHAPYDGFEWDGYEYREESAADYLRRTATDPDGARADYARGVDASFAEFERVLDVLEARGLLSETLVIYTSDHGEVLGEYGFFGHALLVCPETVYVPTCFVHPDLEPGHREGLFHHVDLLPTIASVLGVDGGRTHGTPWGEGRTRGYTHFEHVRYASLPTPLARLSELTGGFHRTVRSTWDADGGHVFVEGSRYKSSLVYLGTLLQAPQGRQLLHNRAIRSMHRRFVPGHTVYGTPGFTADEARATIDEVAAGATTVDTSRHLDDDTVEQLQQLGYI